MMEPDEAQWVSALRELEDERDALAAEVRRLRRELARLGPYPLEAAWKNENGEPDQFMFRRPDGSLLVLTREGHECVIPMHWHLAENGEVQPGHPPATET